MGVYEDAGRRRCRPRLTDAGYYAINCLRLDKGYRAFGSDLTPDHNPVEAGLRFTCKLTADIDFIGRAGRRDGSSPRGPAGAWSRSASGTPARCCGEGSWSSGTASRPDR